jgi:hypothetical protein
MYGYCTDESAGKMVHPYNSEPVEPSSHGLGVVAPRCDGKSANPKRAGNPMAFSDASIAFPIWSALNDYLYIQINDGPEVITKPHGVFNVHTSNVHIHFLTYPPPPRRPRVSYSWLV